MTRPLLLVLALVAGTALSPACAPAPDLDPPPTANLDIPGMEERQRIRADLIARRLDAVLLEAMRNHDIDAWMAFSREHNLDPILSEIGGGWGGVRNAYIFFDRGEQQPEKVFIGSHQLRDRTIPSIYDELIYYGYTPEGIRPHLRSVIEERDPQRIGINVSPTLPMADGLTWTLRNFLEESLGPELSSRLVSAELLIRDFRTHHIPEEWPVFSALCEWTVAWETEAFSDHVITVGETTVEDIHWWMRERTLQLGLANEFLPGVRVNRQGQNLPTNSPDHTIEPGDVLSVDAGLAFIDFRTDIKRTAYVLRPGETEPPESIRRAFEDAKRVTDRLTSRWTPGAIAHEVFEATMAELSAEGYGTGIATGGAQRPTQTSAEVGIYSHSVGNSTHDIGARVAVNAPFAYGDRVAYPLARNAWYSVELHVSTPIPEWDGLALQIMIEENAELTDDGVRYCAPRQEELLLVRGAAL